MASGYGTNLDATIYKHLTVKGIQQMAEQTSATPNGGNTDSSKMGDTSGTTGTGGAPSGVNDPQSNTQRQADTNPKTDGPTTVGDAPVAEPQMVQFVPRQTVVPAQEGMTDVIAGGKYIVNGKTVNANGDEIDDNGKVKKQSQSQS